MARTFGSSRRTATASPRTGSAVSPEQTVGPEGSNKLLQGAPISLMAWSALRHQAYVGRGTGRAAGLRRVLRHADAGEQQTVQLLAQQRGDLAVEKRHPAGARAEGVCQQVQPPHGHTGGQMR